MVDLPVILEDKAKEKTALLIQQIMVLLATNGRRLSDDDHKEFMNQITPKNVENQFNREKFEQLRMLTNMGINRK